MKMTVEEMQVGFPRESILRAAGGR